jgi:hypothetical protein
MRKRKNSTENRTDTKKNVPKQSQIGQNRTISVLNRPKVELKIVGKNGKKSPPRKQKGSIGAGKKKVRAAILNGQWTKYDDFIDRFGVGRSTISTVIKDLSEQGLITKRGHNIVVNKAKAVQ